jgi:transposase
MSASNFEAAFLIRKQIFQQSFSNDKAGWTALWEWSGELCPNARLRFCVEHTGRYEKGLVQFLQELGAYVSVIDSARYFHYALSKGKRGKSDQADARGLAQYSRDRKPEEFVPRPEPYQLFLQLCRARDSFVQKKTALTNQSKAPGVFAEVREHFELHLAVIAETITRIQAQITELEASLPELAESVQLLDKVSGIGVVQARQILSELGPIQSYAQPEKVALAGGLVPFIRQSGTSLYKQKLVKYGNPRLRCALYRAAITAKRSDPAFKAFAARLNSHGNKKKNTVNVACARKMAHVVWAVLTYKTDYDPEKLMKDSRLT